jgi:hypothetical protein
MLDVIHFFMEEDLVRFESGEQMEAASKTRSSIYEIFYQRTYAYGVKSSGSSSRSGSGTYADGSPIGLPEDDFLDLEPFNPEVKNAKKPYMQPTKFNPDSALPFGKDIDSPLG